MSAAESVGGITKLAEVLGVERRVLMACVGGFSPVPEDMFLRSLEVLLERYDALAKELASKQR